MRRKKNNENMDIVKRQRTIGVISGKAGEGVTTLCIGLANYLSKLRGRKVALAMIGGGAEFYSIKNYSNVKGSLFSFTYQGVDYYSINEEYRFSNILEKEYDDIILDIGDRYEECLEELLRCSEKIVLGNVNLYRYAFYEKIIEKISVIKGSDQWLHIVSGDTVEIKKHLKYHSLKGIERINLTCPYIIDNPELKFFEKIIG